MRRVISLAAVAALSACAATAAGRDGESSDSTAYADFLIGRVATLRDDHAAATDRYFAALSRAPATPELLGGALHSALAGGDVRRAELAARMAKGSGADFAMARIVRAVDAIEGRRFAQARMELHELDGDGLDMLIGRLLSIWAKAGERRTDEAVAELSQISSDWPQISGLIDYQRAMTLDVAGRRDGAREAYAAARASRVLLAPSAVRETDLLARMGRRAEAAALYGDGYAMEPDIARALAAAAAPGRPVARSALTVARGAAIGIYGLGAIVVEEGDYDRGLGMLTLALMLDPDLDAARLKFADAQREIGRMQTARAALDAIAPTSPYAETARVSAAWILRHEDRGDEAVALARATAESGGRLSRVAYGDLLRSLDRWEEADAAYTSIIDGLDPPKASDWFLFFARGAAREGMGRWELTEADMRRALELSPDQPEALNFLGYGWIDRGVHLDEGLALIQRAAELRPQSGHIIDSLGWAYFRLGDFERALEFLDRAVELEPADATLNDHLGDVYWRLGRRVEARYQWNRALAMRPADDQRATIEKKVASGLAPLEQAASAAR
jgi:tetratricopeptide (TPR) repeat protein